MQGCGKGKQWNGEQRFHSSVWGTSRYLELENCSLAVKDVQGHKCRWLAKILDEWVKVLRMNQMVAREGNKLKCILTAVMKKNKKKKIHSTHPWVHSICFLLKHEQFLEAKSMLFVLIFVPNGSGRMTMIWELLLFCGLSWYSHF